MIRLDEANVMRLMDLCVIMKVSILDEDDNAL